MASPEENKCYADLLCGHVGLMLYRLRRLPADKWDWAFAPPAPTPRILATHAWQWLVCDRQHIEEPDAAEHALIPDPPSDPAALCDELERENARWKTLILSLTEDQMASPRAQFNDFPMTVRGFIGHMVQNSIYKNGQLATIYFALGLDGDAPYDAPWPNPFYLQLNPMSDHEAS